MPAVRTFGPLQTQARRLHRMAWLTTHAVELRPLYGGVSLHSSPPPPDGRRVYGRREERFADASVDERDRFEGGSVMVWGGIALATKSQLIILEGTVTAVRLDWPPYSPDFPRRAFVGRSGQKGKNQNPTPPLIPNHPRTNKKCFGG